MPTITAAAYTNEQDSRQAGEDLASQLTSQFADHAPDAVVVFASSRFEYDQLLEAIEERLSPGVMVGASSAGEFVRGRRGEGSACALGIRSDELRFSVGLGQQVSRDRQAAARSLLGTFHGTQNGGYAYRTALVMTDALAGHADELVEQLTVGTAGRYQFAGGGAGDDARFARTHVFYGSKAFTDAVVALEILSDVPVGIGVGHGWTPAGDGLRVTAVDGARVLSLNGIPAVEAFEDHAVATGQTFDRADPFPFFLHNIIGIETANGYRLRVPLATGADGSVACAAEIPAGATIRLMRASSDTAVEAATRATQAAMRSLGGKRAGAALFFDCVATRLRMGDDFGFELQSVGAALDGAEMIGCNTYGQIARADGQFGGFHNCTAVVLILPA